MQIARSFAVALLIAAPACAPGAGELPNEDTDAAERGLDGGTVYVVTRQDFRKCAYPMCGGVYVKAVNQTKTTCLDGTKQTDCYVAGIDLDALGLPDDDAVNLRGRATGGLAVLSGSIQPLDSHPSFGSLVATAAFSAHTDTAGSGTFYDVRDTGIVCITAPCLSLDATKVNSSTVKKLADLDFSALGLSADEVAKTMSAAADDGVILRGVIKTTSNSKKLVVSQVFDAVASAAPQASTCVDACGGASADQACFCDDVCSYYGDCCADYADACQ